MQIIELHPVEQREATAIIVDEMLRGERKYCSLEVERKYGDIWSLKTYL